MEAAGTGNADRRRFPVIDAVDLADRYTSYAGAARATAVKNRSKGDHFGESLANTRADVYERAAAYMGQLPPDEAAKQMMSHAAEVYVRHPPLMDFDNAGRKYIEARAWQFCAHAIDPDIGTTAPAWD